MKEGDLHPEALVGTVLEGAYDLTRLVGEGGMGAVYEGMQIRLNRRVAVKVMARDLAGEPESLARFRREVHITSRLAHPHIVAVFDVGATPAGVPFLVMEFLDGEDLEQRLARVRRLPLEATIHIVNQTAAALAATHARRIVHRDLKPANIFLVDAEGETDFVKVLDFGISKAPTSGAWITATAAVMGTPKYMSPEQAMGRGDSLDHRTDQWSLACIAWEMLSGREPFLGRHVADVLHQVVHGEPPSLVGQVPGLPAGVEAVLLRALEKRPADRHRNISVFARALAGAAEDAAREAQAAAVAGAHTRLGITPVLARARPARSGGSSQGVRLRAAGSGLLRGVRALRASLPLPRRRPQGLMGHTIALGQRALDQWLPSRRKRRRRLPWLVAAGIGTTLTVGAALLLRSGMIHIP